MPADNAEEIADRLGGVLPPQPCRPGVMATRHAAAAGHYLATHAAFEVLEAGGNAVDAGVAAGLALGVLESALVSIAGVAPIMIYLADSREVITISGLGTWPKAAYLGHKIALRVLGSPEAANIFDTLNHPTRPLYYGTPWFLPPILTYYGWRDGLRL